MREVLLVAAGGAAGSALRYIVNVAFAARGLTDFPWHTLLVNVLGAFLLGLLATASLERGIIDPRMLLLLGTGFLGGFTTFSALSYETVVLMQGGMNVKALLNVAGSGVVGVCAAWAGVMAGRAL